MPDIMRCCIMDSMVMGNDWDSTTTGMGNRDPDRLYQPDAVRSE